MMIKQGLLIGGLCFMVSISYAETCPSVYDIQHHVMHGFTLYDSDSNQPLPKHRHTQVVHHLTQFALAKWVKEEKLNKNSQDNLDTASNSIHCYYRDQDGDTANAYLAKTDVTPQNQARYWYPVSDSMHCAADAWHCAFGPELRAPEQLARQDS